MHRDQKPLNAYSNAIAQIPLLVLAVASLAGNWSIWYLGLALWIVMVVLSMLCWRSMLLYAVFGTASTAALAIGAWTRIVIAVPIVALMIGVLTSCAFLLAEAMGLDKYRQDRVLKALMLLTPSALAVMLILNQRHR